ncbi:hypothetical protein DICVIV_08164 [Dictyocaulus viviparus]|uniref:Uncharacterized protein n=1 Tax=Dictyocaulus viviparus TaxID=29172 RepID=A0A0D8XMC3_DICVI|nr:hypothetical protein DICVIV_08164 [Dictyocaulus viviparus]
MRSQRVPLKRREKLSSFVSQQTANHDLLKCCRRIYDEKRQTKRRRWNAMRYLHNALPGAVIEGIDVFDMAQRTNLSVAGIFGPEHKLKLNDLPFASEMDNRPAYLDMEELLNLMDHTLAIQSDITVDHEGNLQPVIDFLTVRGLQFKAIMGSDRCHLMVSPAPIPVPPVTVDRYGNMTSTQRAFVPYSLYPEFISQKMHGHSHEQFFRPLESPPACDDDNEIFDDIQCPGCLWTTEDRGVFDNTFCGHILLQIRVEGRLSLSFLVDMDFAQTCLKGLPRELLQQITIAKIDTAHTTYASYKDSEIMTEADLINLMVNESES